MTKRLWIPVADRAEPRRVDFLALELEPAGDPRADPYAALDGGPLAAAAARARAIVAALPPPPSARILLRPPGFALAGSAGATLGLVLAPYWLHPDCLYRQFLALGVLAPAAVPGLNAAVGDPGGVAEKLRAIIELGYRSEPLLLIYPGATANLGQLDALADRNVATRAVATLAEALNACGMPFSTPPEFPDAKT